MAKRKKIRPIIMGLTFFYHQKCGYVSVRRLRPTARGDIMIGEAVRLRRPSRDARHCLLAVRMHRHPVPPSTHSHLRSLAWLSFLVSHSPRPTMPTDLTNGTHSLATTCKPHDLTRSRAALLAKNAKDGKKSCARGQLGRAHRVARWGHVWAQRNAACKGWPMIAPCGHRAGFGRADWSLPARAHPRRTASS